MSFMLSLYRLLARAAFPLVKKRLRRGHEVGYEERCGFYPAEKLRQLHAFDGDKDSPVLWVHAVSVGEVQAAAPFVAIASAAGPQRILLSTVTQTGARNASLLMEDTVDLHVYAPWDFPQVVRRACDALRPSVYVTVETEVWPNLLTELRRREVPTCLMNARLSDRTFARARTFGALLRDAYGLFDLILARGDEDARRLIAIGVPGERIQITGDCKIDSILKRRADSVQRIDLLRMWLRMEEGTICFVAGSTHEGEDAEVLSAFAELRQESFPCNVRLILAPRHPERAEEVKARAKAVGSAALFSELGTPDTFVMPDIVVVDEIGVLFDLYGLATAVFIGGSLVQKGGQNILEPACWDVPVAHGPYMDDFAAATKELDALGAAFPVASASELAAVWRKAATGELAGAAGTSTPYFERNAGASKRAWAAVETLLKASDGNF